MQRKKSYIYKKVRKDLFGRKSNGVDIFPNNIDIYRKDIKILQRKQRFAQSFEKMVQMAINKNGAKDDEHSKANY